MLRLTIFDDDHDLLGCRTGATWHAKGQEPKRTLNGSHGLPSFRGRQGLVIPPCGVLFPDAGPELDNLDAKIVPLKRGHALVTAFTHQMTGLFVGILQLHGMPEHYDAWFDLREAWPGFVSEMALHMHLYAVI